MALKERIEIVVDAVTGNATKELKNFGSELKNASGFAAKGKVAIGELGDFISGNLPQMATAAAGAIVALGIKSVNAFQDMALGAEKMATSTGLTVDAASRWIAVADDVGLSADTVEGVFDKFGKTIGSQPGILDKYGIALATLKDGTTDLSGTALNAIQALQTIHDPAQRAAAAAALFGKGWTGASVLLTESAGDLAKALGNVSEAQVIDEGEIKKADDYRASMDDLSDSVNDLQVKLGEDLVPALASAAEAMANLVNAGNKLMDGPLGTVIDNLPIVGGLDNLGAALDSSRSGWDRLTNVAATFVPVLDSVSDKVHDATTSNKDATTSGTDLAKSFKEQQTAAADAASAASDYDKALHGLISSQLAMEGSTLAVQDSWDKLSDSVDKANTTVDDAKTSVNEVGAANRDVLESVLSYAAAADKAGEAQAKANDQQYGAQQSAQVQIAALQRVKEQFPKLGPVIDDYIARLQIAANTDVETDVSAKADVPSARDAWLQLNANVQSKGPIRINTVADFNALAAKYKLPFATGGAMAGANVGGAGGVFWVGEAGRELVALPGGSRVFPHAQSETMARGAGSGVVNNYFQIDVSAGPLAQPADVGRALVAAIQAYERGNGTSWRK